MHQIVLRLKKIISISLLLILLFSSIGGWVILRIQQHFNYQQVQAQLKNAENLITLTLSKADYENSIIDKYEIKIDGKMYDVERLRFDKDSVTVLCIADEKEDNLFASYHSFEQNEKKKTGSNLQILKFLSLIYIQSVQLITIYNPDCMKLYCISYSCFFKSFVINIESPPPKA